ncbi:MAG: diadenosine tetraphosphatase, partial [Gammaproteobacteria bacterium]|nr:diadenosine tetraphosphatase [Gammaproteobacteria bacterium]
RMRYCNSHGVMNLSDKGPPGSQSPDMIPWFEINSRKSQDTTIVFGHWSTLGRINDHNVIATDTGCLWGGSLTAVEIDDNEQKTFQIECEAKLAIPGIMIN